MYVYLFYTPDKETRVFKELAKVHSIAKVYGLSCEFNRLQERIRDWEQYTWVTNPVARTHKVAKILRVEVE